jgi:hypothetical protein
VQRRLGHAPLERLLEHVREDRLADPAQRERGHRDAELRGRDVGVQLVEQGDEKARAPVPRLDHHLDAGAPHADEGELDGDEEAVGQNE